MADNVGSEEGGWGGEGKPSRASRVSAADSKSSKRMTGGMGLYESPSYEETDVNSTRAEKVAKIIAEMGIPPLVSSGSGDVKPKLWQESATASQSPTIKHLRKSLQQRKEEMKIFTANPDFQDYFYVPKGPEYRPAPTLVQSTMGSKEEIVGREVIHKAAMEQFRNLQGVWSELGKPYVSLGVPNVNISHDVPMPEAPYGVDGFEKLANFDYFPVPPITAEQREQLEAQIPPSKKKRELMLKYARRELEETRMLRKMGLLFFHDSDHAKFPRAPLIACGKITNMIRQGGNYIEEVQVGMMRSFARRQPMQPLEGEQFILGADGSAIPLHIDGPPPSAPKSASAGNETTRVDRPPVAPVLPSKTTKQDHLRDLPSQRASRQPRSTLLEMSLLQFDLEMQVFGWKKKILELRRKLEQELQDQIADREDRREQWRSSSSFSAEVGRKVYNLLHQSSGRVAPDYTTVWEEALSNYNARQTPHTSPGEFKAIRINRFYDRVCTFTEHLPIADPLLDVLIYFLKEWLENGGKLKRSLLEHLCACLARLPDDIMVLGRMACVIPVLQFICKELHITSTEFRNILKDKKLDRHHLG